MARGSRAPNSLYVGKEHIRSINASDGPNVKHPALISYYANINMAKLGKKPLKLIGIDIETEPTTGQMRLIGFYNGSQYQAADFDDAILYLVSKIAHAARDGRHFAHWNKLDAFVMFRTMLEYSDMDPVKACDRWGKVSGEYDRKAKAWEVSPLVRIQTEIGEVGIKNVIRSSVQFYFIASENPEKVHTCWSFDIAGHYPDHLAKTAKNMGLAWYSKMGDEFHEVDWERYKTDSEYKKNVRASNRLDAKAAYELGDKLQKNFHKFAGVYQNALVSQGGSARTAVVADIDRKNRDAGLRGDELKKQNRDDVSSIGIVRYIEEWSEKYGSDMAKELYLLSVESYSAGQIDAIAYGYSETGWYADIAMAYPSIIRTLEDLRGSKLFKGYGVPVRPKHGYVFIRGDVKIPESLDVHPLTIRNPASKHTNIRPVGEFRSSYTIDERDFLEQHGATFDNEEWISITTRGKLSPLAEASRRFGYLREVYKEQGSPLETNAKTADASVYGITYEAVDVHDEPTPENPEKIGYRAGEFWNPIYASIITSRVRCILSSAAMAVKQNGGQPIVLMTDSITWNGHENDLPTDIDLPFGKTGVRLKKSAGYFEKPQQVTDVLCLGSGRYSFKAFDEKKNKWVDVVKHRGLNIVGFDSILENRFTWQSVVDRWNPEDDKITVKVRALVSPGLVANSGAEGKFTLNDLGRVIERDMKIDPIVGGSKRELPDEVYDPDVIRGGLVVTKPIHVAGYVYGRAGYDASYTKMRELMHEKHIVTRKQQERLRKKKHAAKKYSENRDKILAEEKKKQEYARAVGYTGNLKMFRRMSWEKIKELEEFDKRKGLIK